MIRQIVIGKKYYIDYEAFKEEDPRTFSVPQNAFDIFKGKKYRKVLSVKLRDKKPDGQRVNLAFEGWGRETWWFIVEDHFKFFYEENEKVQEEFDV